MYIANVLLVDNALDSAASCSADNCTNGGNTDSVEGSTVLVEFAGCSALEGWQIENGFRTTSIEEAVDSLIWFNGCKFDDEVVVRAVVGSGKRPLHVCAIYSMKEQHGYIIA